MLRKRTAEENGLEGPKIKATAKVTGKEWMEMSDSEQHPGQK